MGAAACLTLLTGLSCGAATTSAAVPRAASSMAAAGRSAKVTNVNVTVTTSGDGIELQTVQGAVEGRKLAFSGTAPASDSGSTIELQDTATPGQGKSWAVAAQAQVTSDGSFSGSWKPAISGQRSVRAELVVPALSGQTGLPGPGAPTPQHTGHVTVDIFKAAEATLYGPGFWGDKTACGQKLSKSMIGVANRKLSCGTKVAIDYHGHELVAPVIDRGPYGGKASWDLTMATAKALGIDTTATIATLSPAPR